MALIFLLPDTEFDRRQFIAECTTACGSDVAGARACAVDWPLHRALHDNHWRVPS